MKAKKILADTLCASMMMSNITPAFATVSNQTSTFDDTTENVSKETEVLYEKAGNYFVTIPKTISLGSDKQSPYSVKVEGDIASDKQVYVSPIDSIKDTEEFDFYMHDTNATNPKDDVVATVNQNKFYWNFSEVANGYEETDNKVTALDLTSGTWKGTFDFEINMHKVDGNESHKHNYTETIIKEPSCTEDGEKTLTCSCGDTKTESIPATGHNITDGSCTECDVVVKTIDDLLKGDVSFNIGTVLDAKKADTLKVNDTVIPEKTITFDKEGDYQVSVETTDKNGTPIIININITIIINQQTHTHNYVETITKNATCTESGEKTLACSCGDSKTETIPSTGHSYGADDKCTDCGELDPDHKHSYTETITKDAGCEEKGQKTLTCVCGDSKTEVIPATGHNYEDGSCKNCEKEEEHIHDYSNSTFSGNWTRDYDGVSGYLWAYESGTTNSIRYKANGPGMIIHDGNSDTGTNSAVTIWKITVPASCTTQIGFKPNDVKNTTSDPTAYVYLNDKVVWKNNESGVSYSAYKYKTITLKTGDNYVKAVGSQGDCIELFTVTGEYQKCNTCGNIAPSVQDWDYELNEEDKTITLKQYTGVDTDVIVCSSYNINGTAYKTRIASNSSFSSKYMFYNKTAITSVKFEHGVTFAGDAAYLFYGCTSLTSVDFGGIDTSNVTNTSNMFINCKSLTSVDLSNFDTSNVTDTSNMFMNCSSLTSIDLSNFDTSNVTNMGGIFNGCSSITSLDLSNFDTSNVTTMNNMFFNCTSLTNVDLSNFDTSKVTNMMNMFRNCTSITSLVLSNFDTSKVTNMNYMFYGCTSLGTIYVTQSKWSINQATITDMFTNCDTSEVTYK